MVTERQLQEAIQHQVLYGGRLGTSLYELGFITEERLQEALARAHGVTGSAGIDHRQVQPEAVAALPRALAVRHKVCPYKIRGKTLWLLMVDPQDHEAVARVSYSLGFIVKPQVVPEFRMIQLLRDHYGVDERWRYTDTHRRAAGKPPVPVDPEAAASLIESAESRDEVVEALLALCHGVFRRVLFFIVREPWVLGWKGVGEGADTAASLRIPLDQPSVFQSVARNRTVFVGRLGEEEVNLRFLRALDKRPQTNAFLFPIVVRGRVVNLLYGDNGPSGNVKANLGGLMVQLQKVSRAYLRIIRKRVADTRKAAAEDAAEDVTSERGNR